MKNILQKHLGVVTKMANSTNDFSPNNSKNGSMLLAMKTATQLITHFFSPIRALASKPVFTLVPSEKLEGKGKIVINLFYYIANRNQALSNNTINSLGEVLSKLFQRPVELRLTRLYYPYMNSYILAQYVAINTNRYNFTRIQRSIFAALQVVNQRTLFNNTGGVQNVANSEMALPSYITGLKITISGRLTTQRSVPRQTVQTAQIGSFSPSVAGKEKNVVESASFTSKNKKGAFTVKVWISQLPLIS